MAEQIPEAWIGQEVIVYFEPAQRQAGTLEDVSERGIVVRSCGMRRSMSSGIPSRQ